MAKKTFYIPDAELEGFVKEIRAIRAALAKGIDVPSESFVAREAIRRWFEALPKKKRR